MQKSLLLTLFVSSVVVHTANAISAMGVIDIIAGIVDGVIHKNDLAEFQKCITDAESLSPILDAMVDDFKEHDLAGYSEAMMEAQQLIMALPAKVETCEAVHDDLVKLGQWAQIFIEPATFIKVVSKNLVWNYVTIHTDINEAITDFDTQQYFDFGEKIGEVLVIATQQ